MGRWAWVAIGGLVVVGAACSGGGSGEGKTVVPPAIQVPTTLTSGTSVSAETAPSNGMPDACKLLSSDQVDAAIGAPATGRGMATGTAKSRDPLESGCTWGELTSDGGVVGVQISRKNGAPIDPLQSLITATGATKPIDVGTNGRLLTKALIPFGGGDGQSIAFEHNGDTVVVGLVRGDQAKLEAAARAVNANLG